MRAVLVGLALAFVVGCGGGGGNNGDAAPAAVDASSADGLSDATSAGDGDVDAPGDAPPDAPPDAPAAPPSYVLVEDMVEVRADIGNPSSAMVHVMNTGGTTLGFTFTIPGEVKSLSSTQLFSSSGCNFVPVGQECIGYVTFFPLSAGDCTTTVTIHPTAGLPDTTIPVVARTYTRLGVGDYNIPVGGSVTSDSPDVTCMQGMCAGHFVGDLTLTATPDPGHVFVGWTEASCGSSPSCVVARSTTARQIGLVFAPDLVGRLTLDMTGAPPGALVTVQDESGNTQSLLAICATNCTVPLLADVASAPNVRITVSSPRGNSTISGACSGTSRCSFATDGTPATITVRWTFDPKLIWASVFDVGPLRSVARGPNGELFVSTIAYGSADVAWTMKLDSTGNVIWAYPTTGQLVATPEGGVAISWPVYGLFVMQRSAILDSNGYPIRLDYNQEIYASDTQNNEVRHFARVVALGANHVLATPGTKNGMSAIEAWAPLVHWDRAVVGTGARAITSDSAGVFYLGTQNAAGSIDATKFDTAGANLGTIPGVAQGAPLVMVVSPTGDLVTTSGTSGTPAMGGLGGEVILRRVSASGQLVFERRVPLLSYTANRAGVVVLPNEDMLWIHGTTGQFGGSEYATNIVAERVSPTGTVIWAMTQSSGPSSGGVEVYDLNGGGGAAIAVGAFSNGGLGKLTEMDAVIGQSWVGMFAP